MAEVTYDSDVKILSIRLRRAKVFDTDVQEDCIIDYDKNGNVINIDVTKVNLGEILSRGKRV